MITLGVFWIKHKYKGNDCDGDIYWGTVLVDIVGLYHTSSILQAFV